MLMPLFAQLEKKPHFFKLRIPDTVFGLPWHDLMHMRERDLTTIFKKSSVAPGLATNEISFCSNVKNKDSPQTVNHEKFIRTKSRGA